MSEAIGRIEPVTGKAFVGDGVTVGLAPAAARFSLRGAARSAMSASRAGRLR
jgi:hypothetical protein